MYANLILNIVGEIKVREAFSGIVVHQNLYKTSCKRRNKEKTKIYPKKCQLQLLETVHLWTEYITLLWWRAVGSLPDVNSLSDLRGKHACFAGVGTQAGWTIPIFKEQRPSSAIFCLLTAVRFQTLVLFVPLFQLQEYNVQYDIWRFLRMLAWWSPWKKYKK